MKIKNISCGKRKKPVIVAIAVHILGRVPEKKYRHNFFRCKTLHGIKAPNAYACK